MRLPTRGSVALATVLALAVPAAASAKTKPFAYHYKIVSASHSSSVSETTDHYNGDSEETWKLRGASNGFPNSADFGVRGGQGNALFLFNVRGTYHGSVTVPEEDVFPGDPTHCEATVSTGDKSDNKVMAPTSAQLSLIYNKRHKWVDAGWRFPMAILDPPIFGSSCSHPDTEFPTDDLYETHYPVSVFKKKRFTLADVRTPGGKFGNYTWNTKITLIRQKLRK